MTVAEKKSRIESLARSARMVLRLIQGRPETPKSEILYFKMLVSYFTRILNAPQEGKPVIAHTVFFPAEILYAMDIVPMHTEGVTWFSALFLGNTADMLAAGAERGLGPEVCSAHRALAGGFSLGTLPRPEAVLWSNLVCDNTAKSGELLMEINRVPGWFLDHPFQHSPAEEKYLADELRDLVAFLEERTGRKLNMDRLSETVARIDRSIRLLREIADLRKAVPSPFGPMSFLRLVAADYLFAGQPEAIEYLETLRGELAQMVRDGKGCVSPERYRLMLLFIPPLYLHSAIEKILAQFGAVTVTEPYFTAWPEVSLDPSRPLESIARKCYANPPMRMYQPLDDEIIKSFTDYGEEYRISGAVNFAHVACRHTCATVKLFKDRFNQIDVPLLNLDCDILDPTSASEEDIRGRFEQFFELLEER
jgi:benzoyl-CoA reductase/2-hydroxyglutaryl-CoA dehydratase subunit BcrC/BadD/HgdB